MFARFARPRAQIMFSEHAVIAPYRDKTALMFRIVNQRSERDRGARGESAAGAAQAGRTAADRDFIPLKLERDRVVFFPLAWTIVHPDRRKSPLQRADAPRTCRSRDAEFLVLLNGFDETFSQTVHTRSSYNVEEIIWGAKFRSMFTRVDDGNIAVDVRKLHEFERMALD